MLLIKEKVKLTTCNNSSLNIMEVFLTAVMSDSRTSSREEKDLVHLLISSGAKIELM